MALFDDASLVVTPNGYKEGTLYSIKPTSGLGDMTVVRATTATRVNSAGLIELVPYNLVQYSEDFSNAVWFKYQTSITANTTIAPNGTLTADTITDNTATDSHIVNQGVNVGAGTYTISVYAKANTLSNINLLWYDGVSALIQSNVFNLSTGITTGANQSIENVGNGWYRCSYTITTTQTGTQYAYVALNNGSSTYYAGTGQSLYIWGAQLVTGTLPKDYLRTETRLNIPRLDYSNGTCPSLLVEPQRTNMLSYSSQFDNGYWNKQNSTITANSIVSPDGTTNADALIASNGTGIYKGVYITEYTSAPKSFSFFAKKGNKDWAMLIGYNGTNNVWFNVANGTIGTIGSNFVNAKIENYGNGWYRCSATLNASTAILLNIGLYVSDADNSTSCTGDGSTTSMYFWGAQLEVGSYPTSYIPTTSAAVTRNADVISKTGISSLIGQTEGTILWDIYIETPTATDNENILNIDNGSFGNTFYISKSASSTIAAEMYSGGVVQASFTKSSIVKGRYKCAFAYANNNTSFFVNGVQVGSTDTSCSVPATSRFQMGLGALGASTGFINSAVLFPTRLTNAELISLTT